MDRDSATKALLALGSDPSTRDIFHDLCLQEMILNMPSIANQALDMFHEINKLSRMEYFYIKELECESKKIEISMYYLWRYLFIDPECALEDTDGVLRPSPLTGIGAPHHISVLSGS